jgi:acylphosphatase
MNKRIQINVFGQVQGVFFRENTKNLANSFELVGFVKNQPDGSVLIVAEGEEEKLNQLLDWTKRGPKWAKVERIEYQWQDPTGEFENFEIKYE